MLLVASFAIAPFVAPGGAASQRLVVPSVGGRILSFVVLFGFGAAYFTWMWSEGRRTLPMKTWQLALVTAAGEPLPRGRACARYVAAWITPASAVACYALLAPHGYGALAWPLLALNWLAAFVDGERQFLHDRIVGARIVTAT